AVLCGLGQFGLIVRATLKLTPAPAKVRRYKLHYDRLSDLIEDQCRLVEQERFDYLEGQVYASQSGRFGYLLEACAFFDPSSDDLALLGELQHNRSLDEITELSYLEFAERLDPHMSRFLLTGEWYFAHPWLNVLLPSSDACAYIEDALQTLSPDEIGSSRVVL